MQHRGTRAAALLSVSALVMALAVATGGARHRRGAERSRPLRPTRRLAADAGGQILAGRATPTDVGHRRRRGLGRRRVLPRAPRGAASLAQGRSRRVERRRAPPRAGASASVVRRPRTSQDGRGRTTSIPVTRAAATSSRASPRTRVCAPATTRVFEIVNSVVQVYDTAGNALLAGTPFFPGTEPVGLTLNEFYGLPPAFVRPAGPVRTVHVRRGLPLRPRVRAVVRHVGGHRAGSDDGLRSPARTAPTSR